ncbi:MAG: VOC family protein [Patescibacteria group bacterium]
MFDHIGIAARDYEASRKFYEVALAALNMKPLFTIENQVTGFGVDRPQFWVGGSDDQHPISVNVHIAFACENRALVDAFYAAAIGAGAKDNGKPGLRPEYHEHYYGAFVLDPDGHNVEAVCHLPV